MLFRSPEAVHSHYNRFVAIRKEYDELLAADPSFQPSRPVVANPCTVAPADNSLDELMKGATSIWGPARFVAPIGRPRRNIFCVGKNYHEHAQEFAKSGFDSSAASGAIPSSSMRSSPLTGAPMIS